MALKLTYDNFIPAVRKVYTMAHNGHWRYGDSHGWPPCSDGIIACDRLIARALWDMGYTDQPRIPGSTAGVTVNNVNTYLPKYGFVKTTKISEIKRGAVVCVGQVGSTITHVFVATEVNTSNQTCNKYDMGSQQRINSAQPFNGVKINEWANRHFICAFNLPATKDYLSKGDKGNKVNKMQRHLNEIYRYGLEEDGIFGTASENAVKDFQKKNGLVATGKYDAKSKNILDKQISEKRESKSYLTIGSKGDSVNKMQRHLNEVYNYKMPEDGIYDESTANLVKDFQKKNGLPSHGNYDAVSKKILDKQVSDTRAKKKQEQQQKVNYMTDFSKYKGKISNSGHDENGKYSGGAAGDQTGTEWQIINWYNRPWNVVLRFEDSQIANLIAELAIEAANNNNIGYDQSQRTTFWAALEKSGYRPKNITTKCEADCSAGVAAIVKAVGYLLSKSALQAVSKDAYTGNLRKVLINAGAKALTDSKYLSGYSNLRPGDILLNEGHHTAISLGGGSVSPSPAPAPVPAVNKELVKIGQQHLKNYTGIKLDIDGDYGPNSKAAFIRAIQQSLSYWWHYDGVITVDGQWGPDTERRVAKHACKKGDKNYLVTALEIGMYLHGIDPKGLENPGNFGPGLEIAVKQYQKQAGLEVDGIAGAATFKKLATA